RGVLLAFDVEPGHAARPLCVRYDGRLTALHDSDHGVRSAEIDADCLGHRSLPFSALAGKAIRPGRAQNQRPSPRNYGLLISIRRGRLAAALPRRTVSTPLRKFASTRSASTSPGRAITCSNSPTSRD